ncbi:MAG: hypothetical protein ACR2P4_03745, partial [Gammaproteobacteria bacterium]
PVMAFAAIVFGRPFRAYLFNTPIHGALPRAMTMSPFQGFYNAPLSRRWIPSIAGMTKECYGFSP